MGALEYVATASVIAGFVIAAFCVGLVRYKNEAIATLKEVIDANEAKERERDRQFAEMKGRIDVLQSTWADSIASSLAAAVAPAVAAACAKAIDGVLVERRAR